MGVIVALSLVSGSCGDDGGEDGALNSTERLVDVYAATVRAVAAEVSRLPEAAESDDGDKDDSEGSTDEGNGDETDEGPLSVFLAEREDAEISAEVQAGVVVDLEDWANVRFIDELDEALEEDDGIEQVRDDGVLIGLGAVSGDDIRASLTVDRYESESSIVVYDVTLRRRSGEWQVEEPLEGVAVPAP